MGADYIDYLIADPTVVPEEDRAFYSEQIVYLPDTYQCNDSHRRIGARELTRAEAGLPEEAFVFLAVSTQPQDHARDVRHLDEHSFDG